jgi:ADP-glucose pyrophosphorylase
VEEGAVVLNSIVMPGAKISKDSRVEYSIIMPQAIVAPHQVVGHIPSPGEEEGGITVFAGEEVHHG